ncbi:unnamed protein product [Adineta ricciae]|nr:unnamed protein product [Adineta ricciae]
MLFITFAAIVLLTNARTFYRVRPEIEPYDNILDYLTMENHALYDDLERDNDDIFSSFMEPSSELFLETYSPIYLSNDNGIIKLFRKPMISLDEYYEPEYAVEKDGLM